MTAFQIAGLRCEYAAAPMGISVAQPRLCWKLLSERRGARQSAYQVLAASSAERLQADQADLWDSGRVESDQSLHVVYEGKPLVSRQRVWWKTRVWDEQGEMAESAPAWWEMGLLAREEWVGEWIGSALVGSPQTSMPCPYLRRAFSLEAPARTARLYITALGLFEASLNGRRIGDDAFTPGWTDYHQRLQYLVYDVTDLLTPGANALGVILADGWYCGHIEFRGRQRWGDRPKLLAQLMIEGTDGSLQTIATDGRWKTSVGPLLMSDILRGESYDARREMPGWDKPDFDDRAWTPVETFPDPGVPLVALCGPTVRRQEEIAPIADPKPIERFSVTRWIYDLGQNMVGRVRFKGVGPAGMTVTLRHGEMLNPDGSLYTENLRTATATDHYTFRGCDDPAVEFRAEETYEPRFTFHGFRYVELSGYYGTPPRDAVTGIVLHSDIPPTGSFECSDPLINQLQHNIVWGQKGNFLEVPTDCPQRDERLGWTGDAQIFIRTACFNRDVAGFFTKWLNDLADTQTEYGAFSPVAPKTIPGAADGGPGWADAAIICPWTIYLCYGDWRILETHYPRMARYMEHLQNTSRDGIRVHPDTGDWGGFGDWLSINAETPTDLIGTAFYAYSARLMGRIARILGKEADAAQYEELWEQIRAAFCRRFVTADGLITGQTQTAYTLALHFDLLPESLRPAAARELTRNIRQRGMHLSTGFVGTPYLAHALTRAGHLDVAYALLHQKTWPSWLYSVTKGATTIWERWDGWTEEKGFQDPGMNSFNHYAYGAIGEWLYATVAGIDLSPDQPGYKRIVLRPRPGGEIRSASASLESLYGRIESRWSLEAGCFAWEVCVPPNTTALAAFPTPPDAVIVESGAPLEQAEGVSALRREEEILLCDLAPGRYSFTVTWQEKP
jgi:alpha-L-rhamnosidase